MLQPWNSHKNFLFKFLSKVKMIEKDLPEIFIDNRFRSKKRQERKRRQNSSKLLKKLFSAIYIYIHHSNFILPLRFTRHPRNSDA